MKKQSQNETAIPINIIIIQGITQHSCYYIFYFYSKKCQYKTPMIYNHRS